MGSVWLALALMEKLFLCMFPSPAAVLSTEVMLLSSWSSCVVGTACVLEGQGKIVVHPRKTEPARVWQGTVQGQLSLLRVSSGGWAAP